MRRRRREKKNEPLKCQPENYFISVDRVSEKGKKAMRRRKERSIRRGGRDLQITRSESSRDRGVSVQHQMRTEIGELHRGGGCEHRRRKVVQLKKGTQSAGEETQSSGVLTLGIKLLRYHRSPPDLTLAKMQGKVKAGLSSSTSDNTGKGKTKMSGKHIRHGYHLVKGQSSHPMEDYIVAEFKHAVTQSWVCLPSLMATWAMMFQST
ncbi:putative protein phosphatase 2C 62 [Platanthera guangdongensis]|uniref:Uncharacterized protein n=1 Tax=Platanthera guangdongensis TaxID=2320717 RepID=A0ABR2M9A1_9ASPA